MKGKDGINIILAACFIENLNCLRAQHLPCSSNQCGHDKKKNLEKEAHKNVKTNLQFCLKTTTTELFLSKHSQSDPSR